MADVDYYHELYCANQCPRVLYRALPARLHCMYGTACCCRLVMHLLSTSMCEDHIFLCIGLRRCQPGVTQLLHSFLMLLLLLTVSGLLFFARGSATPLLYTVPYMRTDVVEIYTVVSTDFVP